MSLFCFFGPHFFAILTDVHVIIALLFLQHSDLVSNLACCASFYNNDLGPLNCPFAHLPQRKRLLLLATPISPSTRTPPPMSSFTSTALNSIAIHAFTMVQLPAFIRLTSMPLLTRSILMPTVTFTMATFAR